MKLDLLSSRVNDLKTETKLDRIGTKCLYTDPAGTVIPVHTTQMLKDSLGLCFKSSLLHMRVHRGSQVLTPPKTFPRISSQNEAVCKGPSYKEAPTFSFSQLLH